MKHQVYPNLWVGDEQDSKDFWFGQQPHVSIDLTGWNIDLELSEENLKTVTKLIPVFKKCNIAGIPVLVYCHAGMDRSPFMAACFIFAINGFINAYKWYDSVKELHPQTIIHDDWMKEFVGFHRFTNKEVNQDE